MENIREFTSTNASYFILDGVKYPKSYEALYESSLNNNRLKVISIGRNGEQLVFSTDYRNVSVNGNRFNSLEEAISAINEVVFSKGGGSGDGGTGIQSIQEGENVTIDNTDPLNPVVSTNLNNSYSTEETLIGGTWIDGKPIYRKVISFNGNNQSTIKINYNIPNLEYIVFYDAYIKTSSNIVKLPNTIGSGSSLEAYVTLSTGQIKVFWGEIISSAASFKFIVEYTKTTSE